MNQLNWFGTQLLLLCVLNFNFGFSQAGSNDMTFNPGDIGFGFGDGASLTVRAIDTLPDGKIMIAGAFESYNGTLINRLARLNVDGTLDTSFNPGTGPNNVIYAMAVQPDGKVIIGGLFTTYNSLSQPRIARINTDGSIDNTFNINGGAGVSVNAIAIQPDGKILIGGGFTTYGGLSRNRIIRLNSDGTVDNTFSIGTGANSTVHTITLQPDGKVIIGGEFTAYNSTTRNRIARLNSDGSYDDSFTIGTGASSIVYTSAVQNDGKIIIAGNFTSYNSTTRNRIVRLNSNGTFDNSFSIGTGANGAIWSSDVQPDGKILLGGSFTTYNGSTRNRLIRLNSDGTSDNSFDIGTGFSTFGELVYAIKLLSNNQIFVGGFFNTFNGIAKPYLVKLNSDSSVNLSFNPSSGANNNIVAVAKQADGKILIGGGFTLYNGVSANRIARLNVDGGLDTTFDAGLGANGVVISISIQNDGKIIVAGAFTEFNGVIRNRIARLNSDGSIDGTFNSTSPQTAGANATIQTTVIQPDGKIIIGGDFSTYSGSTRNRITRLNPNGSIDTSFNPGAGALLATAANSSVYSCTIQPDGKILIGGDFTSYNDVARNRIARLNSNGTLDTSFDVGSGANHLVLTTHVSNNGKIYVGGLFMTFNGSSHNRIVRLNDDGSIDQDFNSGSGVYGFYVETSVRTIAELSDGKVVIAGQFEKYNEIDRINIARLNSDGNLDHSFDSGSGTNFRILNVLKQQDEKVIITGNFTSYNQTGRNRIARILIDGCNPVESNDIINSCTPITWIDGNTYSTSNNTATHLLVGAAQNGCDSLVTLNLTLNEPTSSTINATIAQGQSYVFDSQNLTAEGTYFATFQNTAGCDSVVTLNLTIVPALQYELTTSNTQICAGDEVELAVNLLGANYPAGYVHCNPNNPTAVVDVTNPTTGKTWMDRNLGANRAAISSTDAEAYGSMFQWGRFADGHQCVNRFAGDGVTTSSTTSTVSTTGTPSHGDFIITLNAHWQNPVLNNLWQGVDGINNPCPVGYRLPTQAEMNAERLSWQQAPINSTNNIAGAFASPLKFTMGGRRNNSNAALTSVGSYGSYWTGTAQAFEETSSDMFISTTNATVGWNHNRSTGLSVRCIKN